MIKGRGNITSNRSEGVPP